MSPVGQTSRSAAGFQARPSRWVGFGLARRRAGLPRIALLLFCGSLFRTESRTITVLATTDLHGNLYPIDYVTDRPAPRGLAKIATLISAAASENPNHLLIDCGDTIQGTPLESVYQSAVEKGRKPGADPMILAMNRLGYDAMTVGNHEYNFGLKNLNAARDAAHLPWLSANTVVASSASDRPFAPYLVKTVAGIKVAVIGITTPVVPTWERAGVAWKLTGKHRRVIPVTSETPAAADVLEIGRPYHDAAERYLNTPVGTSERAFDAALGRVADTAVVDAIQPVQLFYGRADVSFTALFNASVRIPKGQVTVRQIAALYPYDNELYVIEGTGRMVKDALENAARYYRSCAGDGCGKGPLVNHEVMGFNYDMAEGVEYAIDLERPEGDRIRDLRRHTQLLAMGAKLRIAVNDYRAAASAGYSMFRGAKIVWRSGDVIRDLMIRFYTDRTSLPAEAIGNWRVLPELAQRTLEKEAAEDAARQHLH